MNRWWWAAAAAAAIGGAVWYWQATATRRLAALAFADGRRTRALVLDCGSPERTALLIALVRRQPGLSVLGVDAAPDGLRLAEAALAAAGLDAGVELQLAPTRGLLTFGDAAFDLIVADADALLVGELPRLLRPGGRALLRERHGWTLLGSAGVAPPDLEAA